MAERRQIQAWTDPDWQRLWLTLDHMPWRTLALVPGGAGGPPDLTLRAGTSGNILFADGGTTNGLGTVSFSGNDVSIEFDTGGRFRAASIPVDIGGYRW